MSRVFILTMAGVLISTLELSVPIFGQIWVTRYNGPANDYDYASAIAVDGSGNIYVTGTSWGSGSFNDYATVKYNSSGDSLWVARYNGPDNSYDEVSAVAVNRSYVYVTGGSMDSNLCYDYATSKYNSLGNSLWVARYNGPANDNDYANAIAVDGSQNVYVTGYSTGSGTWWDCATTKYDSSGVEQWVKRYITNDYDYAIAIAIDGLGNIYVTGSSGDPYTSNWDFMTIKYASYRK
ncbi:MAG: SBBP repeat-containing protein [Candidatus Stahlbacteria bacterium]|nr:SBBP repeat-containing protein [Candidatus Stahlbacteria bacterium]